MDFDKRLLAITDVETLGLDPATYEMIEIGLVLVDQSTLKAVDSFARKIRPTHPEVSQPEALKINGFNEKGWAGAAYLPTVLKAYAELTKEAVFCSHNVTFDWGFVNTAFMKTGIKNQMDYHRLDLLTLAWFSLYPVGLRKFKLEDIARFLGIPPKPAVHRALNGATLAYRVFKALCKDYRERVYKLMGQGGLLK